MKLFRVSYRRNLILIYLIISILFSLTLVNVPVKSDPYETRLYIRESPPGSWVPGVTPGPGPPGEVWVTIDIESPLAWDNTSAGIVGWVFSVHVDPAVLRPLGAFGASFGYFMYDFIDWNYVGSDYYPVMLVGEVNATTGKMVEVGEAILDFPTLGVGAGGNSNTSGWYGETNGLARLRFKSLSETAHTPIDIYDAYWVDVNETMHAFDVVDDGHYNEPLPPHTLTVKSTPFDGIDFTINSTAHATNTTVELQPGTYTVTMPSTWMNGTDEYNFMKWEDSSTDPVRSISLTSNITITATYETHVLLPNRTLTVESTPIDGVNFTVDSGEYVTNATVELEEGGYTVAMPSTWMNGTDQYNFRRWENDSTDPVRSISLTSNITITATYGPPKEYTLTVNSSPITGINFTIDVTTTHTTNWSTPLLEGDYLVEMPLTWTAAGNDTYTFERWENDSTSRIRVISLASNMTITATYELVETRLYIRESPPGSWMPGVAVDDWVWVTVDIESPLAWDNTSAGIVGWVFSVHVDPAVLEVSIVQAANLGYFLFDFIDWNYLGSSYYPKMLVGEVNATTGKMVEVGELINDFETLGVGAGGNSNTSGWYGEANGLVQLRFKSKSADAYTLIDIYDAFWVDINEKRHPFDVVDDGHYNEPIVHLTVESTPFDGIDFTINSTAHATNTTVELQPGTYTVTMPSTWMSDTDQYGFMEWEDASTDPARTILLTSNMTITATYVPVYNLTVESTPFDGINFTIGTTTYMTNRSVSLLEERDYTVTMPSIWMNGTDQYNFRRWENDSTNRVRTISLTADMTIIATYVPVYNLTVESTPFDGINFKIGATFYKTNKTVPLEKGLYTVTLLDLTKKVDFIKYYFRRWEDNSTNPVRTISLTADMTITAIYEPPPKYTLTVNSSPIAGINFTLDVVATRTTNWTGLLYEGVHSVEMPSTWTTAGGVYNFDKWKYDSTNPIRSISLTSDKTITAIYALVPPPQWTLHVNSDPITDINFTLDGVTYATIWSDVLTEGNYTIVMPSTWTTVEDDVYNFTQWEDASTSPSRVVSLTSNITITATYTKLVLPIASFTFSPTEPIVNETVTFNASASNDPDGTIVSYAWDFGDGASDSGAIVEHAYTAAGTYNVSLTVTDNDGLTHTITKSITIEEAPPPGIPWYVYVAAAGIAAIIIVAIAFYFLRIKKPKPT